MGFPPATTEVPKTLCHFVTARLDQPDAGVNFSGPLFRRTPPRTKRDARGSQAAGNGGAPFASGRDAAPVHLLQRSRAT